MSSTCNWRCPTCSACCIESGGLILVRVAADEAEILTLAVIPGVRRSGIGHALLQEATSMAAALGARVVFLEVSVTNIAARALYTKAGFVAGRPTATLLFRSVRCAGVAA